MAEYEGFLVSKSLESSMYLTSEYPKNKYVFFKQIDSNLPKTSTILFNPRFRDNTKVFINPNFPATTRPNIHVNPNIIKSVSSVPISIPSVPVNSCISRFPLKSIRTDDRNITLVKTKNKLINIPESKKNEVSTYELTRNSIPTSLPSNKVNLFTQNNFNPLNNKKLYSTRMKIVNSSIKTQKTNNSLKRCSINSKFKYVRTSGSAKKVTKNIVKSRHKIVNNISNHKHNEVVPSSYKISPNSRRKFVFVNKYISSSFLASNVILKNTRRKSLVNINGILYQNSPSVLKKAHISNKQQKDCNVSICMKNPDNKPVTKKLTPGGIKRRTSITPLKQYRGKYKLIRPRVASLSKLKKSNVPCPIYKRFGKCSGQNNNTCIKIHNPDQIILCTKFLQGACIKKNCLLSHKVSPEKMPTCKYYLEGLCTKDDCQYLHVKISPKADICKEFLEGFCKAGNKCDKRHQFLCPDFEKSKKCPRRRCEYPHGNFNTTIRNQTAGRKIGKFPKKKETKIINENIKEKPKGRYYDEAGNENKTEETLLTNRPRLGSLPSFIPFSEVSPKDI